MKDPQLIAEWFGEYFENVPGVIRSKNQRVRRVVMLSCQDIQLSTACSIASGVIPCLNADCRNANPTPTIVLLKVDTVNCGGSHDVKG